MISLAVVQDLAVVFGGLRMETYLELQWTRIILGVLKTKVKEHDDIN